MSAAPIPVVAGAALRGGRVLVVRRPPGGPHGGLWEFPGGKVEAGEGEREALIRELREELDVGARVGELIAEGGDGRVRLRVFEVQLDGDPRPTEGQECAWVGPGGLSALELPPADRPAARRIISRMRGVY